jgi:hypothetical protein
MSIETKNLLFPTVVTQETIGVHCANGRGLLEYGAELSYKELPILCGSTHRYGSTSYRLTGF